MLLYFICYSLLSSPYLHFISLPAPVKKHMRSLSCSTSTNSLMLPLHNTTPTGLLSVPSLLPCSTQRQAPELISGPDLATRARLLSFNRTQSRVVIGLLTGHKTLRRHLHIMGLSNNPICRKCGIEEEISAHILCECEALVTRHAHWYQICNFS